MIFKNHEGEGEKYLKCTQEVTAEKEGWKKGRGEGREWERKRGSEGRRKEEKKERKRKQERDKE